MAWTPTLRRSRLRGRQLTSSATSGARDEQGVQVPYHEDPIRNRAAAFIPTGYLSDGYDTGRGK